MFETLNDAIKYYADCIGCPISEAKADAERAITQMMADEKCSREFAEATWMEETEELDKTKLNKIEKQVKQNGVLNVKSASTADKPKAKREIKPNEEKRKLISMLESAIKVYGAGDVAVANVEREVTFTICENHYSVTLTCHRKKKG